MSGSSSKSEELGRALTMVWAERGIDGMTLATADDGTIPAPESALEVAEDDLPLLFAEAGGTGAPFVMGQTIGAGGMGIVRAARQRSLHRDVAIKTLRPEIEDRHALAELLREARVIGTLQHPNIVPVHALGRDAEGRPMIVMKRIEGTSWREVLRRDQPSLDRHLEILIQIARAVHFAHRRGVLHRDIKPANVMLGEFGEVYLVDWGIAVALRDDVVAGLALARDVDHVAGTPEYMAPEMAAGDGAHLDERSDVFLLGATLHELLAGEPPHRGQDLQDTLARAYAAVPPSYPDAVPAELGAIATRAMHVQPAERFADAEALARAIEAYREHRSSLEVSREARTRLGRLEALVGELAAREQIHAAFSECRFGFAQAIQMWAGNTDARGGLQHTLETMIEYELAHGSVAAAEPLLLELVEPRPALAQRIHDAAARDKQKAERLAHLERESDPTSGDRRRGILAILMGTSWLVFAFLFGYLDRTGILVLDNLHFAGVWLGGFGVAIVVTRSGMRGLEVARQRSLVWFGILAFPIYALHFCVARALAIEPHLAVVMMYPIFLTAWLATVLFVDRRAWILIPITIVALVVAASAPSYSFEITGAAAGLGQLWLGAAWLRTGRD